MTQQHTGATGTAGGGDVLLSEMLPLSVSHANAAGRRRGNAHLGVVASEEGGELFAETGYC